MEMRVKQESTVGFVAILLWCVVSASSYVLTSHIEQTLEPTLLCFGIFLCTTIFFVGSRLGTLTTIVAKCKGNFNHIFSVNVTTLGCWFLTIYPLKFLEPAIVNSAMLSTLPIATLAVGVFLRNNKNISRIDYITALLLFFGIIFLALICFEQKTAVKSVLLYNVMISFVYSIIGGVFLAINNIYSKKLSNEGFSPFDILTVRFFLITIVTGMLSYHALGELAHLKALFDVIAIATLLIIIPQIFFQYALKELEPFTISMVAPLMPVLTFFMEFSSVSLHPTIWTIIGVLYICTVSSIGTMARYKNSN